MTSGEKPELRRDEHGTTETAGWGKQGEQGGKGMETNGEKETVDGDWTEGSADQERKGDCGHLYGPKYSPACQQNPFEYECLDVSFDRRSDGRDEKRRGRYGASLVREKQSGIPISMAIGRLGHGTGIRINGGSTVEFGG